MSWDCTALISGVEEKEKPLNIGPMSEDRQEDAIRKLRYEYLGFVGGVLERELTSRKVV